MVSEDIADMIIKAGKGSCLLPTGVEENMVGLNIRSDKGPTDVTYDNGKQKIV